MKPPFSAIDHVQLAIPSGEEEAARGFYRDLLGMREVEKPPELRTRGGCWFESGTVQIHLGIEEDFRPAKKAHPALNSTDYGALIARLRAAGVEAREVQDVPGVRRCHIHDPFGNRIELIDGNPRRSVSSTPNTPGTAIRPGDRCRPAIDGQNGLRHEHRRERSVGRLGQGYPPQAIYSQPRTTKGHTPRTNRL